MKKIILPIISFLLLFTLFLSVYVQLSSAAPGTNCWNKHMTLQMTACTKDLTKCLQTCASIMESSKRLPCFAECNSVADTCRKQASADYSACVKGDSQSEEDWTAKTLKPTEVLTPQPSSAGQTVKPDNSNKDIDPSQLIDNWIKEAFGDVNIKAIEEAEAIRLYGRTPQLTEAIIKKAQEDWENMLSQDVGKEVSPYRLDAVVGQIQIKLPGQEEWSDIKVGDRIPPGSTIFTGMDTTTVLSIKDKGAVQIQSFTEVTISEEGLKEAAKTGQTYTDIKLRTGEVELNVEGGVFTGSLQTTTPTAHNAVRGTHFWVSYDEEKGISTTGVYKGQVEVTARGSNKPILVSPNGNKPGVVVIARTLSVTKLVLAALVAIIIVVVVVFILRKRFSLKSFKKKR